MRPRPTSTVATYAMLCLAGSGSFMLPAELPGSVDTLTPAPLVAAGTALHARVDVGRPATTAAARPAAAPAGRPGGDTGLLALESPLR